MGLPAGGPTCRRVNRQEIHEALRLILGTGGKPAGTGAVVDFARNALAKKIMLEEILVATVENKLCWAALAINSPGHTAMLLVPDYVYPEHTAIAGTLAVQACRDAATQGAYLVQVLMEPAAKAVRELLGRVGFETMAELIYLQASPHKAPQRPALPTEWAWQTYTPNHHALFRRAILESYEQSLDCPKLSGKRDIEDIIAGHRATGSYDPALWLVLMEQGRPLGVLLLSVTAPGQSVELVYLGLAPCARGKGVGDLMMQQALWIARQHNRSTLTLAVDAANIPAKRLYFRHGLARIGSRIAMMCDVRSQADRS